MSEASTRSSNDGTESVYEAYILDVRILESTSDEGDPRYRFDAPQHVPMTFHDPELATLYADVYFDTNGFQEEGTGERGVPPEVIQAGRDTLAAYFLTMPGTDLNWVASFYGKTPPKIERYIASVRERAREIRANAVEQGLE
ncbi:hypothetical protein [Natronorubrum aibiense]|uniref:Uncharacterized protein n=1 Tax=Natronorubrum aibiense TaxID=348826 RepID=A0A5P9P3J6_9EURY|nr:hypothetical protein [Natronorubrum aibiense]QFU82714.1 hypothetical protein GCU68_09340 [Natronorubrum aibiense]